MPVQIPAATRGYSDYILYPNLTETAVQDATPTESYGNFGLAAGNRDLSWRRDRRPVRRRPAPLSAGRARRPPGTRPWRPGPRCSWGPRPVRRLPGPSRTSQVPDVAGGLGRCASAPGSARPAADPRY